MLKSSLLRRLVAQGVSFEHVLIKERNPVDIFGPLDIHTYMLGPAGTGRGFCTATPAPPPPPDPCNFKPMLVPR